MATSQSCSHTHSHSVCRGLVPTEALWAESIPGESRQAYCQQLLGNLASTEKCESVGRLCRPQQTCPFLCCFLWGIFPQQWEKLLGYKMLGRQPCLLAVYEHWLLFPPAFRIRVSSGIQMTSFLHLLSRMCFPKSCWPLTLSYLAHSNTVGTPALWSLVPQ